MDSATLAQQVVALRLVTPSQLDECLLEIGGHSPDPSALIRALERKSYLTPLQIDKLLRGDRDGYFLGGYRLLYRVASGSFGRVYRGDDPNTNRIVAIKVLRRRWSEDPSSVELFEREGRVGMSLRHPNIVEILAVGQDPITRQFYIVMDFVEGGNLRDLLAIRKKFDIGASLKLMEEMASALAYAFARGVTHRDIKLTNILISSKGVAGLVDFGLARMYNPVAGRQRKGEDNEHVQRTVDYAGLEKATGVPHGDVRSDIFFLGCVLYEMLTGRSPMPLARDRLRDKHARMQRDRFMHIPPIQPEEVPSPAVIRLVETMMSIDPLKRYQTPAQLLEAIRDARVQVEGGKTAGSNGEASTPFLAPTVFVVEKDPRLQDVFRDKLKKVGYRVLIAGDPARAMERFNQQGFNALVVDAGTAEDDGIRVFKFIVNQAHEKKLPCRGILILSEDQRGLADVVPNNEVATVMSRPLKLGHVIAKLKELVPVNADA